MSKILKIVATALWVALAAYETIHDMGGRKWGSLAAWTNVVGIFYVPLWLYSAFSIWTHSTYRVSLLVAGAITPAVHGAVILVTGDMQGAYYFASAPILAALLMNADLLDKKASSKFAGSAGSTSHYTSSPSG